MAMASSQGLLAKDWWAQGDTPVHNDSHVTYFVDGRMTMYEMCIHYLRARKYIYLANWGMTPKLELVRGRDHRAGPDGSPEQARLIEELRIHELTDEEINFWLTHDLSLLNVLGFAVSRGVEVRVLLWNTLEKFAPDFPQMVYQEITQIGGICFLDDSSEGIIHHPAESLHQKISIVDGVYAFVGGIDPLIEKQGDFDRWDTPVHLFASPLRQTPQGTSPHPWHDAHAMIEGPAAADVELNFRQRWNDVVQHKHLDEALLVPQHDYPQPVPPQKVTGLVQIARTIPQHTYHFGPHNGIQGIAQLYAKALRNAEQFIYLENQYFWLRAYTGIDISPLGIDSADMERNIRSIGDALRRGAFVSIVLPDHPNVGRAFTDAGLTRLQEEAPEAVANGHFHAFILGTMTSNQNEVHYRPTYVHAKVAIVDDLWATVGSGNLNNRGMRDDTEMNVATLDPVLARELRLMLWAEHLGLLSDQDLLDLAFYLGRRREVQQQQSHGAQAWQYVQETIGDPGVGFRMMFERAQENLQRYKAKQPLVGYLLPYLKAEEAVQQGLNFREEHGWVEEE
jgi:phosphatidylserine/phosphatidylglycerophosphate/cardiolipin synthase-like enzyme